MVIRLGEFPIRRQNVSCEEVTKEKLETLLKQGRKACEVLQALFCWAPDSGIPCMSWLQRARLAIGEGKGRKLTTQSQACRSRPNSMNAAGRDPYIRL